MTQLDYRYAAGQQTNGLAIAGFVCSMLGFVTGIMFPIGLILSLVAIGRRPRGFAIAGLVIGLFGTCGGLIVVGLIVAGVIAVAGIAAMAAFIAMNDPQRVELTFDMAQIAEAVEHVKHRDGVPPAFLTSLNLDPAILKDPWGRDYVYMLLDEGPGYEVTSLGPDGVSGTNDDLKLSKLDELWNNYFEATADQTGGTTTIRLGDKKITMHGGDQGGKVKIETDGKVIELTGDDQGGRVIVSPTTPGAGAGAGAGSATQPAEGGAAATRPR